MAAVTGASDGVCVYVHLKGYCNYHCKDKLIANNI